MKKLTLSIVLILLALIIGCDYNIDIPEKYIVKFVTNTNLEIPDQIVNKGEKVIKPQDPVKDGYIFDGWYVDDEKWVFSGCVVVSDITLNAKFVNGTNDEIFNFKNSVKENEMYKLIVSNSEKYFDFENYIEITGYKNYYVRNSINDSSTESSIQVPLSEGDNCFFIFCEKENNSIDIYKIDVYRKHLYRIDFYIDTSEMFDTQFIEEGEKLDYREIPVKDGYIFDGWNYDFTKPINENLIVTALWSFDYTYTEMTLKEIYETYGTEEAILEKKGSEKLVCVSGVITRTVGKNSAYLQQTIDGETYGIYLYGLEFCENISENNKFQTGYSVIVYGRIYYYAGMIEIAWIDDSLTVVVSYDSADDIVISEVTDISSYIKGTKNISNILKVTTPLTITSYYDSANNAFALYASYKDIQGEMQKVRLHISCIVALIDEKGDRITSGAYFNGRTIKSLICIVGYYENTAYLEILRMSDIEFA